MSALRPQASDTASSPFGSKFRLSSAHARLEEEIITQLSKSDSNTGLESPHESQDDLVQRFCRAAV